MAPPSAETAKLLKFAAEKKRTMGSATPIIEICRRFREETGSTMNVYGLCDVIERASRRIHEIEEFDMDTKARIIMALSAPANVAFLIELEKHANVEYNGSYQILRYEYKTGMEDDENQVEKRRSRKFTEKKRSLTGSTEERRDSEGASSSSSSSTIDKKRKKMEPKTAPPADQPSAGPSANSRIDQNRDRLNAPIRNNVHDEEDSRGIIEQKPRIPIIPAQPPRMSNPAINANSLEPSRNPENDEDLEIIEQKPRILNRPAIAPPPEEHSTSVKNLLMFLRNAVMAVIPNVGSRWLSKLVAKIETKIETMTNKTIPLDTVSCAFDACLCVLKDHAEPKSEEQSTSLRDFLMALRFATCHIRQIEQFHSKLNTAIFECSIKDQQIPIKMVCSAVQAALLVIDPRTFPN